MTSQSDYQQSSSSGMDSPTHKKQNENEGRDRSRSRDRSRIRKHERDQYRSKKSRKTTIKVPQLSGYLYNFKAFLSIQTEKLSNERANKQYENYKRSWEEHHNQIFLGQHKNDAWFIQKYNPQLLDLLEKDRKYNVKEVARQFYNHLKSGYYENINLTIEDPNTLGFVCNNEREQDEQALVVPINNQCLDISLNCTIDITKQPLYAFDPDHLTIFIKAVPKTLSKSDIIEVLGKMPGFKSVYMSDPVKKMSFARYCWVTFNDQESFQSAKFKMSGLIIKNEPLSFSSSTSKNKRAKVLKNYPRTRLDTDADIALKLIKVLDKQCQITDNPLYQMTFDNKSKRFDIYLLYLRRVHGYDYFSGNQFQNQRALCLKLGLSFLRIQADYEQLPDFSTIFKKIHQAAYKRVQNSDSKVDYMNLLREEIQKMVLQSSKLNKDQINADIIWKCDFCQKKFKTCEFLSKHIILKHVDIKMKKIQALMESLYLKDPNKITNYPSSRQDRDFRNKGRSSFRKDRRRDNYKDLDQPEVDKIQKTYAKPMINFLDI